MIKSFECSKKELESHLSGFREDTDITGFILQKTILIPTHKRVCWERKDSKAETRNGSKKYK